MWGSRSARAVACAGSVSTRRATFRVMRRTCCAPLIRRCAWPKRVRLGNPQAWLPCDTHRPATCGGRTPSSTASTSRRSRLRRRRRRRHRRADRADRLCRRPRRDVPVADAVLSDAQPRRRLRHHRLPRRRSAARRPRRLRRGDPHTRTTAGCACSSTSSSTTPPTEHPWFQAARADPDVPCRGFYVWPTSPPTSRRARHRPGDQQLDLRRHGRPVLPAPLLRRSSPTSTSPTRPSATRSRKIGRASGCSSASSGFRMDAVPFLLETSARRRRRAGSARRWLRRAARVRRPPARRRDAASAR